jgi:hypothetical protein
MTKKERRLRIHNSRILAKNNKNVNLVGNQVIFMEISKQVMIFIKNILISLNSRAARRAQRKINIHHGEISITQKLKIQISGRMLIRNKKNNRNKTIRRKKKKEKSHGMEDIHRKKKIFSENIIMETNIILKKMQGIKMQRTVSTGMTGNRNLHLTPKIPRISTKIQSSISLNSENLRKKRKNNIKNTSLEKTQTSTNKIEEHMRDQICLAQDGKLG